MKKIRKVIIPAAGFGTRFLPATKSQPKEMLPIVDKPCIQYLVEEAVESGIKEIIIITGSNKRSIEDHFDHSFELDFHLRKKKKVEAVKELERIEKMAKFTYVRQPEPKGDGHALLCAKHLINDEPVAVLFGDDIYDSKVPPLAQLIKAFEKHQTPVIALQQIDKSQAGKYGIVKTKKSYGKVHEIENLVEKPTPQKAPSNLAITGKYIITPELFNDLAKSSSSSKDKEIRLIDGMRKYIKHSPIHALEIEGTRFDTGDKMGYLKAVVHFALKHKDLRTDFKKHLKDLAL